MDWAQFVAIVSALVGWTLVLTRQIVQRMDHLVETARQQEQAITDEFLDFLRESLRRTEETYKNLECALEEVQEVLRSLRQALYEWHGAHRDGR